MLKKYQIMAICENEVPKIVITEPMKDFNEKNQIELGGNFETWEEADVMARIMASREIINLEYVSMR